MSTFQLIIDILEYLIFEPIIVDMIIVVTILHIFYDVIEWVKNRY